MGLVQYMYQLFAIKINQMWANIPYMDPMGTDCLKSIYLNRIFDNKILGTVIAFDGLKLKKQTGAFL